MRAKSICDKRAFTRLETTASEQESRIFLTGFTLIELLIVISITFLLASISIPALQRARHKAKAVVCQSNLRQWGIVFPMYLEDNDGRFFPFFESVWCEWMQPYYRGSKDLLFCPMAARLA